MSAAALLDTLRARFEIKSDAALARELDLTAAQISKLRSGTPLGATAILSIHEHLGVPVSEIRSLAGQSSPQQYHDKPPPVS